MSSRIKTDFIDFSSQRREQLERFVDQLLEFEEVSLGMFPESELASIKELRVAAQDVLRRIDSLSDNPSGNIH